MKISDAFPSEYLRASDLQGKNVTVLIDRVEMREIGDGHKPVIFFQHHEKGLVCNKTNANNIAAAYGDDTDFWQGAEIVMFPAMVDFQGRTVEAIRVRVPPRRPVQQRAAVAVAGPRVVASQDANELNPPPADEVPF